MSPTFKCRLSGLILITGIFSGCAPERASRPQLIYESPAYRTQSCEYAFETGGSARTVKEPRWENTYFNKSYNRAGLEALYEASAQETVRFAEDLGLRVYQSPRLLPDTCSIFAPLSEMPQDVNYFMERYRQSRVVGVFLEQGDAGLNTTQAGPVTIIRQDSNRYVLVHELMHFFFYQARTGQNLPRQEKLRRELEILHEKWGAEAAAAHRPLSPAIAQRLFQLFVPLVRTIDSLVRNSLLEETVAESILIEEFNLGRFKYLPDARKNARQYILEAFRAASFEYAKLKSKLDEYEMHLPEGAELIQLRELKALISNRKSEMHLVAMQSGAFSTGRAPTEQALAFASQSKPVQLPCSHSQDVLDLLKQMLIEPEE